MERRRAAPTTQRPDGQPCGSGATNLGRDSISTAMLALQAKSNRIGADPDNLEVLLLSALLDDPERLLSEPEMQLPSMTYPA